MSYDWLDSHRDWVSVNEWYWLTWVILEWDKGPLNVLLLLLLIMELVFITVEKP